MRDLIISIFGAYTPIVDAVGVDGNLHMCYGLGTIDFTWIAGVILFVVVLWCLFRLIGGLTK